MENPCHSCIVRPNCTSVCSSKLNYKTLLKDAIRFYAEPQIKRNSAYNKTYRYYLRLQIDNNTDINTIERRSIECKNVV